MEVQTAAARRIDGGRASREGGGSPGGESSWELLVRQHEKLLARRVSRALRGQGSTASRERVEELLQEVYCRLFRCHGHDLGPLLASPVAARMSYLYRVVHSVVQDTLRGERAAKRGSRVTVALGDLADGLPPAPAAAAGTSPEERALARVGYRRAVATLRRQVAGEAQGRRNLRILLLAAVGEWSSREIAQALPGGMTPSGIESILYRLRLRLRAGLGESWGELAPAGGEC